MRKPTQQELAALRLVVERIQRIAAGSNDDPITCALPWIRHVLLVNSEAIAGHERAVAAAESDLEAAWQYLAAQKKALRDAIGDAEGKRP